MPSLDISSETYGAFLADLKSRISTARLNASRAVNRELINLYWDIGLAIKAKQESDGWGEAVVEKLARDLLEAFPGSAGFSSSNLWRMRQAVDAYLSDAFLAQLVREMPAPGSTHANLAQAVRDLVVEVPWGHHVNILLKIEDPAARLHYLRAT